MEDSAQKGAIHLDEEEKEATKKLHGNVSKEFNKTGLPSITPQALDSHHESLLEGVRHFGEELSHDVIRVGKEKLSEVTVGTHHINVTEMTKPYSIETERESKKAEESQKKAA